MINVEFFDGVVQPTLPAGWTAVNLDDPGTTNSPWITASRMAYCDTTISGSGQSILDSPVINVLAGTINITLTFQRMYYLYKFQTGFLLQMKVNGGGFSTLTSLIPGSNYDGILISGPLAGQAAWTGNSPGLIPTTFNITVDTTSATTLQFRWLLGASSGRSDTGAFIDNVVLSGSGGTIFSENFQSVSPPFLPVGWLSVGIDNRSPWITSPGAVSPFNSAYAPSLGSSRDINPLVLPVPTDNRLVSASVAIPAKGANLLFKNLYKGITNNFPEFPGNGYILEISFDNGVTFTEITAAGGSFNSGNYNALINNPDGPMPPTIPAWSGSSGNTGTLADYIDTSVLLPASSFGQNVKFAWRLIVPQGTRQAGLGVQVDNIQLSVINIPCLHPNTLVLSNGKMVPIQKLRSGDVVTDIKGNSIPIVFNMCCPPSKKFIQIDEGALAPNIPSSKLLIRKEHPIMYQGREINPGKLVGKVAGIRRVNLAKSVPVWSLCTKQRTFVMMENVPVATWEESDISQQKKFTFSKR